jgi:hypothetical protein
MFRNIKQNLIGLLIEVSFAAAVIIIGVIISTIFSSRS